MDQPTSFGTQFQFSNEGCWGLKFFPFILQESFARLILSIIIKSTEKLRQMHDFRIADYRLGQKLSENKFNYDIEQQKFGKKEI